MNKTGDIHSPPQFLWHWHEYRAVAVDTFPCMVDEVDLIYIRHRFLSTHVNRQEWLDKDGCKPLDRIFPMSEQHKKRSPHDHRVIVLVLDRCRHHSLVPCCMAGKSCDCTVALLFRLALDNSHDRSVDRNGMTVCIDADTTARESRISSCNPSGYD